VTPLVDAQGRIFGRVNLIDALIALLLLAVLPLGYGAYRLFRTPSPTITSVERAQVTSVEERAGQGSLVAGKLKVHGTNLRPMLRATIGGKDALAFIFESPTSADVLFSELPAGTHDLRLLDGVREVARANKALTVAPRPPVPTMRVRIVGTLIGLDAPLANQVKVGMRFPPEGSAQSEIVALGDVVPDRRLVMGTAGPISVDADGRFQRDAAVVVACEPTGFDDCRVTGIQPGFHNLLPLPGATLPLTLRMEQAVPAAPPRNASIRLHVAAPSELADLIHVGDQDESIPPLDDRTASIASVGDRRTMDGDVSIPVISPAGTTTSLWRAPQRMTAFDAVVRAGVDPVAGGGWQYRAQRVVAGGTLRFATKRYVVTGTIVGVALDETRDGRPSSR
jgi:hypothetical protein